MHSHLKRILSIILIAVILFLASGCSLGGQQAEGNGEQPEIIDYEQVINDGILQHPAKNENFRYVIYDTYIAITEYVGKSPTVVIPATLEDLPVYVIDNMAFKEFTSGELEDDPTLMDRGRITSVTIPEGIVHIREEAFSNCEGLKEIKIPSSVSYIGRFAFNGCVNLTEVTFSEGNKLIDERAFGETASLKEIVLPETIESIGDDCFANSGITNITFPSSLAIIPYGVCSGCLNLVNVKINEFDAGSIQTDVETTEEGFAILPYERSIGGGAFSNCPKIQNVWIPGNFTDISGDVFSDSNEDVTLYSYTRSTAAEFAAINRLNFKLTTKEDFSKLYNETVKLNSSSSPEATKPQTTKPQTTTKPTSSSKPTNTEKQKYYENYFRSGEAKPEKLYRLKMGDYIVSKTETKNGNVKLEIQIDKTHKLTSYYVDKVEYVEYNDGDKTEWFKTTGDTTLVSLMNFTQGWSVNPDTIKSIKYISTENGIDTVEIEDVEGGVSISKIRESSKKVIFTGNKEMEMNFSDAIEENNKISFTKPSEFTEKSAHEIQQIIFTVMGM